MVYLEFFKIKKDEIIILPGLQEKMMKTKTKLIEQHELNRDINRLVEHWKSIMAQTNTYNNSFHTYTLSHIEKKGYGYHAIVYAPDGLALPDLEKLKPIIESNLGCTFLYEISSTNALAACDIVYENQVKCNEILFKPQKVKPWQLYGGVKITGEPIIFDLNKTPHALVAGQQRRGKNGCIDHAITSWIYSCSPFELQLILYQGSKNDMVKYKKAEQVMAFIMGDMDEFLLVLQHTRDEMHRRTNLLEPMVSNMKGDNVFHYNQMNSQHNRIPYIIIVIDEFMSLMPESSDDKETKSLKNEILDILSHIARWGGALGVNHIISHQKPEKELMPTFLKNQSLVRICFGFDDKICSQIVLGNDLAYQLPPRRAYYTAGGKCDLLFTTDLTGRIEQYIRPHFLSHRTILDNIKSQNVNSNKSTSHKTTLRPASGKVPKQEQDFSKVDQTAEEVLEENIKKISGYIPYAPLNPDATIINQANTFPHNTQKLIKTGGKVKNE